MQISSNHSGFNFNSVYKSVVTRHIEPAVESPAVSSAAFEITTERKEDENAERMHREALLLQTAQRAAERTSEILAATPDL